MSKQIDLASVLNNPLFLKLKNVVENGPYHDHEDVYSHVIKTKDIAQKEIKGDFIENIDAKNKFLHFTEEDFHGFSRGDLMILTTFLHDIGKILSVREGNITHSILVKDDAGNTMCPGHEYWGSTIVPEILKDLSLPKEIIDYMASVIRNHDIFNPAYFESKANLPFQLLINDVKSRAEGVYKEALFNIYCDCFTAVVFQDTKEKIIKVFTEPILYERRKYIIL